MRWKIGTVSTRETGKKLPSHCGVTDVNNLPVMALKINSGVVTYHLCKKNVLLWLDRAQVFNEVSQECTGTEDNLRIDDMPVFKWWVYVSYTVN